MLICSGKLNLEPLFCASTRQETYWLTVHYATMVRTNNAMHCNYVAINYCLFLIEYIKGLFKIKFSDKASQYRSAEEAAYINFVDFLDQCEGND